MHLVWNYSRTLSLRPMGLSAEVWSEIMYVQLPNYEGSRLKNQRWPLVPAKEIHREVETGLLALCRVCVLASRPKPCTALRCP